VTGATVQSRFGLCFSTEKELSFTLVSLGFYKEKLGLKQAEKVAPPPLYRLLPLLFFFGAGLLFLSVFPSWPNGDKLCLNFPLVCKKNYGHCLPKRKEKLFLPIFLLSFWWTKSFICLEIPVAE